MMISLNRIIYLVLVIVTQVACSAHVNTKEDILVKHYKIPMWSANKTCLHTKPQHVTGTFDKCLSPITKQNSQDNKEIYLDIALSEELNNHGIVFRVSDVELISAKNALWAVSLQEQLTKIIANYLEEHEYKVVSNKNAAEYILKLYIDEFSGHYEGYALIIGKVLITNPYNKNYVLALHIKKELEEDGYPSLVRAMSEGVKQASEQIVNYLTTIIHLSS